MTEAEQQHDDEQPPTPDLEVIVPEGTEITVNGIRCRVRRLQTREFLALLRVATVGLGGAIADIRLDFNDPDSLASDLTALLLLALPSAPDEFLIFLALIVEPVDADDRPQLVTYLHGSPDPLALMDVFEVVATQEKDDLAVLAGKARAMWSRLRTLYQPKGPKKATARKRAR